MFNHFATIVSRGRMQRVPLESTTLASVVYDSVSRRLEIEFRSGNDTCTSRCPHAATNNFSPPNPRVLTSIAASATASPISTCHCHPPPLSFPLPTKLSDIGLKACQDFCHRLLKWQ